MTNEMVGCLMPDKKPKQSFIRSSIELNEKLEMLKKSMKITSSAKLILKLIKLLNDSFDDSFEDYASKVLNELSSVKEERDLLKVLLSDTRTSSIIIPEKESILVEFRSSKLKKNEKKIVSDLSLMYSRLDPKNALKHAQNLNSLADCDYISQIRIVGETFTRLSRMNYPVVSAALKRLLLKKSLIIDGTEFKGLLGALEIERIGLSMTLNTRTRSMLINYYQNKESKKADSDESVSTRRKKCKARLSEALSLWSVSRADYDSISLLRLLSDTCGKPVWKFTQIEVDEILDNADMKISSFLAVFDVEFDGLSNRSVFHSFFTMIDETEVVEQFCSTCNKKMSSKWIRCPYHE